MPSEGGRATLDRALRVGAGSVSFDNAALVFLKLLITVIMQALVYLYLKKNTRTYLVMELEPQQQNKKNEDKFYNPIQSRWNWLESIPLTSAVFPVRQCCSDHALQPN